MAKKSKKSHTGSNANSKPKPWAIADGLRNEIDAAGLGRPELGKQRLSQSPISRQEGDCTTQRLGVARGDSGRMPVLSPTAVALS